MASSDRHPQADAIVTAARDCLGTRFRKQGRSARGLDCAGLVVVSARGAGIDLKVPTALPYRGLNSTSVRQLLVENGCRLLPEGRDAAGDILLFWMAERQPHLAVRSATGLIEAHAGIGCVVERKLHVTETQYRAWRLPG